MAISIARASGKILYHFSQIRTKLLCSSLSVSDLESLIRNRCLSGNNLDLDEALGYFNSLILIRPLPDIWSFNYLFGSLSKLGHYSLVVSMYRLVSGFSDFRPQIGTLTTVMSCFCRLERIDLVFSVLATTLKLGLEPNAHALTTLLHALCSQGSTKMAVELLDEIVAENLPRNEFTYATVINGLCKAGEVCRALALLRKSYADKRVRLDALCFGPVIDSFCKTGRTDEALSLFAEMVQRRVLPRIEIFNSMIHGLLKCGLWDEAERLFIDMEIVHKVFPNPRTYNVVIDAFCKEEKFNEAVSVFESMVRRGFEPSIVTFSSMLSLFCRTRRFEEGLRLFKSMKSFGIYPNIYMFTMIFDSLCKRGMVKEAIDLMAEERVNPDLFVYTCLIRGLCGSNNVDLGFSVLAVMVKRGVEPDDILLASLLRGLCFKRSKLVSAKSFFRGIAENYKNVDTYGFMICGLCKVGEIDEALALLERMWVDPRIEPGSRCYDPIISGFCKEWRLDEALGLFEAMVGRGVLPDPSTCRSLIRGLSRAGRWGEANRVAARLGNGHGHGFSLDSNTRKAVIESLGKKIDTREAIPLLKSITNSVSFSSMLSVLSEGLRLSDVDLMIRGFCGSGRWVEAIRCLERVENCSSSSPSFETFSILINSLVEQRRSKEALMVLKKMVERGLAPDRRIRKLLKTILEQR